MTGVALLKPTPQCQPDRWLASQGLIVCHPFLKHVETFSYKKGSEGEGEGEGEGGKSGETEGRDERQQAWTKPAIAAPS